MIILVDLISGSSDIGVCSPRSGFSVCMATYNGSLYLREQIDSILAQLTPADELVVADDGSTDDTPDILRSYGDQLRLVSTARVGGVVANFERVLHHASKPYVLLCDQDDVWLPGRLELFRKSLSVSSLVVGNAIVTDAYLIPVGATLFQQIGSRRGVASNVYRNSFVGCCMGFRRSLMAVALPIPSYSPWHDWLIGLLGLVIGGVTYLDEPLMYYRRHEGNASPTGGLSSNSFGRMFYLRFCILVAVIWCLLRSVFRGRIF